ncbi:hypothetical protein BCCH1_27290 [Burkholderia contaminans]|uniref:Uncharacterized protein n=1 Tax=Burkholderia contaminans TaxID=488447 RepID=A0A250L6U0_9BURK|nr:hypothetical protein BCCH1_27290 [Burkholderia contaminans]GLZ72372.1 hypothetical protein Bcon01_54170 [Burkholderia contaminans]
MGGSARNGADAHEIQIEYGDEVVGVGGGRGDGRGWRRDGVGRCDGAGGEWLRLVVALRTWEYGHGFWQRSYFRHKDDGRMWRGNLEFQAQ